MNFIAKLRTVRRIGARKTLHIQCARWGIHTPWGDDPHGPLARRELGLRYIRGRGIEIGAAASPLSVSRKVKVAYVDRYSQTEFTEYVHSALFDGYDRKSVLAQAVRIDIADDGETLATIGDETQDFVIANHVLEHTQDPLGTLQNWFRVLKPGGVLFMAVPEKRLTFDAPRPVTPLSHLIDDHENGVARSRRQHFEEFSALVRGVSPAELEAFVEQSMTEDESIHFHVWTQVEILEMLLYLRRTVAFDIELCGAMANEFTTIARKL